MENKTVAIKFISDNFSFSEYTRKEIKEIMFNILQDSSIRKQYKDILAGMGKSGIDWLDIAPENDCCLNEHFENILEKYCDKKGYSDCSNAGEVRDYNFIIDGEIKTLSINTY